MNPNDYLGIKIFEGHGRDLIAPGYGYRYMGADPNIYYNIVVGMVEYHIDTLPIFQDILDTSGPKVKYGGFMGGNIIGFTPLNDLAYQFINLSFNIICRFFHSFGISS